VIHLNVLCLRIYTHILADAKSRAINIHRNELHVSYPVNKTRSLGAHEHGQVRRTVEQLCIVNCHSFRAKRKPVLIVPNSPSDQMKLTKMMLENCVAIFTAI
jgi:hypothetical protein